MALRDVIPREISLYAATTVFLGDQNQKGDDPNSNGTTQDYDQMERKDGQVKPDIKADDKKSDKNSGSEHPAYQMDDDLDERDN